MATEKIALIVEARKKGEDTFRETNRFLDGLGSRAKAAGKLMAGGLAIGVGALAAFGAKAISAASDVEEMQSKFDTVFKNVGPTVTKALDDFSAAAGRNKFELRGMAAELGDLFKPLGFTESAAGDLSVQMVKLATDLSSFNNMSMDEALQRLRGTLIGSHENALAFGVVINENVLKQELAAMGADKLTGAQLEQAKVQARLNLLMKGTTDAQGDAIRTSGSWANQMRALKSSLAETTAEIGTQLLPIMTPILSKFAEFAADKGPALAAFLAENLPAAIQAASDFWTGTLQPAIETVIAFIQDPVMPIIESLAALFFSKHEEMGASADSTWGTIKSTIDTVAHTIQTIVETVFGAVQEFWRAHGEEIKVFADTTWGKIKEIIDTTAQLVKAIIETTFGAILSFWQTHHDTIMSIARTIWDAYKIYIDTILGAIQGLINTALALIQGDWSAAWSEIKGVAQTAWDGIKAIIELVGPVIIGLVRNLVDDIVRQFTNIDWGAIGSAVIDGIKGGISNAAGRLASSAADAARSALNAAKRTLGIGSPSKAFKEVGGQMMAGVELGIATGADGVVAAIRQLVDQVSAMMETMLATINQKVVAAQTALNQMASNAMATADTVAGAMTAIASETLPAVPAVATAGLSATDRMLMDLGVIPGGGGFTGIQAPAPLVSSSPAPQPSVEVHFHGNIIGTDQQIVDAVSKEIGRQLRRMGVMA